MLLQNEAADVDEDLEHFEDITENEDNEAIPAPDNKGNKGLVADTNNGSDNDSEESLDQSGSVTSGSEEDSPNEADDLLGVGGFDKLVELKSTAEHEVPHPQGLTLPGGYNPRHREPTYW